MNIIPAIDLQNSQCVRLYQGDFEKKTIYSSNPIAVAREFEKNGATHIHLINLDGAKNKKTGQNSIALEITEKTTLKVQTGGGIRDEKDIATLLNSGIDKVVIGSMAIEAPKKVLAWLEKFGKENLVLAFDIKTINNTPSLAINGWQEQSEQTLWNIFESYPTNKLKYILCTDIEKDGTLTGPNLGLYSKLHFKYPTLCIQASGGIASIQDIRNLQNIGISSTIIGKAIYEKKLMMQDISKC